MSPYHDPRHAPIPSWMTSPTEGHPIDYHPGVHRLPVGDTRNHYANRACWCQPTQTERIEYPIANTRHPIIGGTWQHHAADGRSEARDVR